MRALTFSTSALVTLMSASIFSKYCWARSASLQSRSNRLLLCNTKENNGRTDVIHRAGNVSVSSEASDLTRPLALTRSRSEFPEVTFRPVSVSSYQV